jgi:hypothetical protein
MPTSYLFDGADNGFGDGGEPFQLDADTPATGLAAVYGSDLVYHWFEDWVAPDWTDDIQAAVATQAGGASFEPQNTTTPASKLALLFDVTTAEVDYLQATLSALTGSTGQQIGGFFTMPASGTSTILFVQNSDETADLRIYADGGQLKVSSTSSTVSATMVSGALTADWHTFVLDLRSGSDEAKLYVDGVLADTETATFSSNLWDWTFASFGPGTDGGDAQLEFGSIYIAAKTSSDFVDTTDAEDASAVLDTYIDSGAETIAVTTGTFALTGNTAGTTAQRKLTADAGTFALTGNTAGTTSQRRLTADAGTFALTGNTAGLAQGRTLTADAGTFALTGNTAGLATGKSTTAATGSFALSGQSAGLTATRALTADAGTFALTGNTAGLAPGRTLVVDTGSFALSGQAAGLAATRALTADTGSVALSGQAAGLAAARALTADMGSFALSGQAAGLATARALAADTGTFAFTGNDAALSYEKTLTAATGTFAFTGNDAGLTYNPIDPTMTAATGSFALTGGSVSLLYARPFRRGAKIVVVAV